MEEKKELGNVQKLRDEQLEKVGGGAGTDCLAAYDVICRNCGHRWQEAQKPTECPNCKSKSIRVLSSGD